MKHKILIIAGIAILAFQSLSAQSDSATFVSATWIKMNVAPGITLCQHYFGDKSLFSSNQNISILEIDPNKVKIDIVGDTVLRTVTSFAEQYDAEAAVNGSFFDMSSRNIPYNSVEYLKIDGEKKAPSRIEKPQREFFQNGFIAFKEGQPYILKADVLPDWEDLIIAEDGVGTGPVLIIDGKDEELEQISFNKNRHPRTAAAIISKTKFILIVVDGRAPEAQGMSLFELQKVFQWLGAKDAINLDGGGSSAMYVKTDDTTDSNIVNKPSDNRKFDDKGERNVANAIIVNTLKD